MESVDCLFCAPFLGRFRNFRLPLLCRTEEDCLHVRHSLLSKNAPIMTPYACPLVTWFQRLFFRWIFMKFSMGVLNRSNWASVSFLRVGSLNVILEFVNGFLGVFYVSWPIWQKLCAADLLIVPSSICEFRENRPRECRTVRTAQ
jgi:hypothetical protein